MKTEDEFITIGEASKKLGVSIETLRRWDRAGKVTAVRFTADGHRRYRKSDIELLRVGLIATVEQWINTKKGVEPSENYYCRTSDVFLGRMNKLETELQKTGEGPIFQSLIAAISSEIGNNSFDHNLGSWPDIPGAFFGYSLNEKIIVLADRGQGVLATLRHIKSHLSSDEEALLVAFTEVVSGRQPEQRGNGLKFVRNILSTEPIDLIFRSGNAELEIRRKTDRLIIGRRENGFHGCLAIIQF